MERGFTAFVDFVRVRAGGQQQLQAFQIFPVEHVLERVRPGGPGAEAKQEPHACEVLVFGRMVERFAVVRIGSSFQQCQAEGGIVVQAGRTIETRKRIAGQILRRE